MILKVLTEKFKDFDNRKMEYLNIIKILLKVKDLDYSKEEMNNVHRLTMEKIGSEEFEMPFITYCGESFMFHNGGEWSISKLKKDSAFGTPIIINWGGDDYPWVRVSPYVWLKRMRKGIFRGNLSEVIL